MAFELRGFLTGIALELSANPLFLDTGKKIVAYSYNGTVLPKLPEWDKETYPYAYIHWTWLSVLGYYTANLYVTDKKVYCREDGIIIIPANSVYSWYKTTSTSSEWSLHKDGATIGSVGSQNSTGAQWTNAEILNENGSVYLSASDPIPVYE